MTKGISIKATVFDFHGRVMSSAYNSYEKTHPRMAELSKKCGGYERTFLHAEVLAIIRALKIGKPHKIKIERYFKNGEPAMAAPCQICLQAIKEAGITVVEHTVG